jgi:gliding motility-associated-like protein
VYKSPSQDAIEKVVPTIESSPEELQIEDNEVFEKIKLPNTFTPNMDGVNDEFKILLVDLTAFSIVILDAKNKIVYKSEDPEFKWNGVGLNGEMVDSGNYIYYITAKNSKGKDVLEYSTLTIIR